MYKCVCQCALTPPKILDVLASYLAQLITIRGECHKGFGDVMIMSESKIILFTLGIS